MKITQHTITNLVVKDSAGCLWLFGLFFIIISGTFVLGLSGAFTNLYELNELERAGAWFVSLSGLIAGIWFIYSNPVIRTNFDKREGIVSVNRRGLLKNENEKYQLNEINDIVIVESIDDEGDPIFSVEMKLMSGKTFKLTKVWLRDKERLQKNINSIKDFLEITS